MSKYIHMTRTYLLVITVFVLLRFILELAGLSENVTSEISVTRLLLVLPVFLGLRFARESLGGWKQMVMANFVYVLWGSALVIAITLADTLLELGTHYTSGGLFEHLFWGHLFEFHAWSRLVRGGGSGRGGFCGSLLIMTVLSNVVCLVTIKLNGKAKALEENPE